MSQNQSKMTDNLYSLEFTLLICYDIWMHKMAKGLKGNVII